MTGLKLVLTTDVNVGDIQHDLKDIYKVGGEVPLLNSCLSSTRGPLLCLAVRFLGCWH